MFDLRGRVCVVTGGSRGLGYALAVALHEAGASLSLWSRRPDELSEVAARLGAHHIVCDVRDRSAVDRAVTDTVDRLGKLDVMVVNAGASVSIPVLDMDVGSWNAVLATNLDGAFWSAQAAARQMATQGTGGKIIVISSIRAAHGTPTTVAYAASKSGVEGMVRAMAVGLASHGIQVNAVRPGVLETDMTEALRSDPHVASAVLDRVPARRWGRPADVAGIVVYFASSASDYHSGDVVTVDGAALAGDTFPIHVPPNEIEVR